MHNPDLIGNGADILSVCGQGPLRSTLHYHRVYFGPRVPAGDSGEGSRLVIVCPQPGGTGQP